MNLPLEPLIPPEPERVLLVDDDQKLLAAFEFYLARSFDVSTATSGLEALQQLENQKFSVVVTDMQMPHMTGVEFIKRAREIAPDVVYQLLTASRESKTAVEAYNEAEVFCVINKPCAMKDLAGFIEAGITEYKKRQSQ